MRNIILSKRKITPFFRSLTDYIYLYTNFYKHIDEGHFIKSFDFHVNEKKIFNNSIEDTIKFWVDNTQLMKNWYAYRNKKLFTMLGDQEIKSKDITYKLD
jgi:hypothetical protein